MIKVSSSPQKRQGKSRRSEGLSSLRSNRTTEPPPKRIKSDNRQPRSIVEFPNLISAKQRNSSSQRESHAESEGSSAAKQSSISVEYNSQRGPETSSAADELSDNVLVAKSTEETADFWVTRNSAKLLASFEIVVPGFRPEPLESNGSSIGGT